MLDAETKRRIDTARDILVGKVPDPKSQVEQITIALIYKFMDDIDSQSEELGGERSFFAGDFARYGWARLMRSGLGGHDILNLYAEAITRMPENPGIPPLFRDIFNNAYLPYRDPETLRAFLKVIDEFEYDNSERLGDAFEYLLSVMGAQGDAGQFRTPRHIIDFIVAVVAPKKHETVLDPACGTAGFLISSYKHILAANTDADGQSTLTPDEKGRLAGGFSGYDISPDMVRLSLVNMYLHGFADPHIQEYDTLTSEERWNEYADVILANPPFMSPKGGIRPHNRFSVTSRRSEVLFVDYMAEHLTPSGRAGIIVPEGIIFQIQKAHTRLRKMLVEEFLVAVVSLPAGVFKPYSGVKTSILILDRALARRTDRIAFFKVENDGFDLGDQRRPIGRNDLPQTAEALKQYLNMDEQDIQDGETESSSSCPSMLDKLIRQGTALIIPKQKIAATGDYNLNGERYRPSLTPVSTHPMVPIGEICDLVNGRAFKPADWEDPSSGGLPIVRIQNLNNPDSTFNYYTGSVRDRHIIYHGQLLFSWSGSRGTSFGAHIWNGGKAVLNQHIFKVGFDKVRATKMYLFHMLNRAVTEVEENLHGGVGLVHITKGNLEKIQVPLPPLDVQREIAAEIEGYQKVIDGARAVIENYRPHIPIDPEWPMVEMGDVCAFKRGPFGGSLKKEMFVKEGYAVYEQSHAISQDFSSFRYFIDENKFEEMQGFKVRPNDVIMSCSGTMGRTAIVPESAPPGVINQALLRLAPSDRMITRFLKLWMDSSNFQQSIEKVAFGAAIRNVASVKVLKCVRIPLPPLETQQTVVSEIEAEQGLVNANRELIGRFEEKIHAAIDRVWGDG